MKDRPIRQAREFFEIRFLSRRGPEKRATPRFGLLPPRNEAEQSRNTNQLCSMTAISSIGNWEKPIAQ